MEKPGGSRSRRNAGVEGGGDGGSRDDSQDLLSAARKRLRSVLIFLATSGGLTGFATGGYYVVNASTAIARVPILEKKIADTELNVWATCEAVMALVKQYQKDNPDKLVLTLPLECRRPAP